MLEFIGMAARCARSALLAACCTASASALAAEATDHAAHMGAADHDPHAHHRAMLSQPSGGGASTTVRLLDLELVNQDGEPVRFARDVIGDRVVVMDFVYTTCTTVCPVLSAVFGQLQGRLGERLGRDVFLVSVSVDPIRDTPSRLQAYAAQHQAGPGWIWLTGDKPAVDRVLEGLGAYAPNYEDHPPMVLVGDGKSGNWTRFFGFPGPDQLLAKVDELVGARVAAKE